jgi:hypothetical protein
MVKFEIVMSQTGADRFDALMEKCVIIDSSEIFKNALGLFEEMVRLHKEGYTFIKTKDGEEYPFEPFEKNTNEAEP